MRHKLWLSMNCTTELLKKSLFGAIFCIIKRMTKVKILQLNAWTGRVKGKILDFLVKNEFDVICLQEVLWTEEAKERLEFFAASLRQIKEASGLMHELKAEVLGIDTVEGRIGQGNVILSRSEMIDKEVRTVHGELNQQTIFANDLKVAYVAERVKLESGLTVVNYHGYWQKSPLGNETSTEVMTKVIEMFKDEKGPVVMCGDLNLGHAAPAMRKLDFLTDLTHKHKVKNTLQGLKFGGEVACDHILVNDLISEQAFTVHDEIISDHKALSVELHF